MVIIDIPIKLLLIIIFICAIVLGCLYAYLIYKQMQETNKQIKKETYIKRKQHDWHQYLINDAYFSVNLIPKQKFEIQVVEEILLSYIHNFNDSIVQTKIKQFSNEYLAKHYKELLRSRNLNKRMTALYRIFDFQIDELIEDCKLLENQRITKDEHLQLLKIYALATPDLFIKKLIAEQSLSDYAFKKLLLTNDDRIVQELIKESSKLELNKQFSMIETIGLKRNLDFLPFLESLLEHENLEIRIQALKAIFEIGVISDSNKYLTFVESPNWEERLMVAKVFQHLPLTQTHHYLEQMIQDPSWWVRYQAATTIMNGKNGKQVLQNIITTTTDRYAIDVAREVLKN